jgi:choline-sulfatase
MKPANVLFILSDEHSRRVLGCYGHETIRTPNLDRLAADGVRFSDAYCNSPICVPSRASLATGRYPHQIRFWDNRIPYDGSVPSWHHRLKSAGHEVVSIGKLHFRSADDDNGFTEEVMPLHVVDGIGDPAGWLRQPLAVRKAALRLAKEAGRGDSDYQGYDGRITDAAVDWLKARAAAPTDKPWALFVSLVCPHFPLIARPEWYDLYPESEVPVPALYDPVSGPTILMFGRSVSVRSIKRGLIRRAFGGRSPPILGSLVMSITTSAGSGARWPRVALPTRRGSSIRATTAITSALVACGANRRCTRKRPACR